MRHFVVLVIGATSLAACSGIQQDTSAIGKAPGIWVCGGEASVITSGQALVYGANGSIMFKCGTGAYFGGGFPAQNLPLVPSAATPSAPSMPPLGPMPPVTSAP